MNERLAFRIVATLAALNFIAFGIASFHFGLGVPSAAMLRPIANAGPYFLDNRGRLTEVSRPLYVLLMWQSRIIVLSWISVVIWRYNLRNRGSAAR